jgi:hypothetical protein
MLLFSGVVLVALAAVGAGLYAQQKRASTPKLSAEDWIEIRQLYSRYAIYIDRITDNGLSQKSRRHSFSDLACCQ